MHIQYFRKHVYNACKTATEYVQEKFGLMSNQRNSMSMLLFLLYTAIFTEEELNDTFLNSKKRTIINIAIERLFINAHEIMA
jgi:hypothetical protein